MSILPVRGCTCPHGMAPGGRLHGVNMGPEMARLSTTKDCPVHDACQRFTLKDRASRSGWSDPWCPKHTKGACPDQLLDDRGTPS